MAFNGSAHFKPGELVSYFESIGARLGPHVNAYTSFDETVYMLDLPTDKPEIVDEGADGARRLRRRPVADSAGNRQGARRRHRGVARRPRRRLADPRQAVPGALPPVALRGAAADRQAGDPAQRAGGAAARVLRHLVSPRSHGGRRRRRHRSRQQMEQAIKAAFSPVTRAGAAAAEPDRQGAAAPAAARQRRHRPGGHAVERVDRAQAAARGRSARRRLPARPGRAARSTT